MCFYTRNSNFKNCSKNEGFCFCYRLVFVFKIFLYLLQLKFVLLGGRKSVERPVPPIQVDRGVGLVFPLRVRCMCRTIMNRNALHSPHRGTPFRYPEHASSTNKEFSGDLISQTFEQKTRFFSQILVKIDQFHQYSLLSFTAASSHPK